MSAIGRMPASAAPTAAPAMTFSEIGRVDDPVTAEVLGKAEIDPESTAEAALDPDVLADQEHRLVAEHLLDDRLAQGLADRQPPHGRVRRRHRHPAP